MCCGWKYATEVFFFFFTKGRKILEQKAIAELIFLKYFYETTIEYKSYYAHWSHLKKKKAEILTCDKSEIHFLVKYIWVWNVDLCDDKHEEISLYVDAWLMLLSKSNYQCFFYVCIL